MVFSTQPATTLLPRTPRNTKTLTIKTENLRLADDAVTIFDILLWQQDSLLEFQKQQETSWLSVFAASLVSYIETLSSGTLNLVKEFNQDQLEAVCGTQLH